MKCHFTKMIQSPSEIFNVKKGEPEVEIGFVIIALQLT